jgi:hypothetical protein
LTYKAIYEFTLATTSKSKKEGLSMLPEQSKSTRSVGIPLGLGIFFMPLIFAWFTLRKGHSVLARVLALGWCGLLVLSVLVADGDKNKRDKQPTNTASVQASNEGGVDTEALAQRKSEHERETLFCQILERTRKQYKEARALSNSIAKEKASAAAVQARKDALGDIPESFVGWVAQVKNVSALSSTLSLNVGLPCDKVKVELKHTRLANSEDEAIFASLEKGGWVLVSGSFYPGTKERDHFREMSITESGSMDEPEFQVAFFKVKPIKNETERHTTEEEAQLRATLASFHDELLKEIAAKVESTTNPAHDQLSSMLEQQRRSVFAAFLVESGESCQSVTKTFYQGSDDDGNAFWNVACSKGNSYVIQVNSDATGTTQILDCAVLKALNAGTCFTKFKN